ncbi:hypothetical protein Q3G72_029422 [Acer saccharum]|nr:hypothetical protein Q3G72_029422 [Acer saccharum]
MISKVVGELDGPYGLGASQQKHEGNIGLDNSLGTNVHVDMDIKMGPERVKIDRRLELDTQLGKRILAADRDG